MRISHHLPASAAALAATGALLIAGHADTADTRPATSTAPRQATDAYPARARPHVPGASRSPAPLYAGGEGAGLPQTGGALDPYCTTPSTSLLSVEWDPRTAILCGPVPLPHAPCTMLPPGIALYVDDPATDWRRAAAPGSPIARDPQGAAA